MSKFKDLCIDRLEPEQKAKVEKAMELSHGAANSTLFCEVAKSSTATPEMMAEIAKGLTDDNRIGRTIWSGSNHLKKENKDTYWKKAWRDQRARMYDVEDTFLYRAITRTGLDAVELRKIMSAGQKTGYSGQRQVTSVNDVYNVGDEVSIMFSTDAVVPKGGFYCGPAHVVDYGRSSDGVALLSLFYTASKDLREKISSDNNLNTLFVKRARVNKRKGYVPSDTPSTYTEQEYIQIQKKLVIQEFDWLAHADQVGKENLEKMVEVDKGGRYYEVMKLFSTMAINSFRYPAADMSIEVVQEAFRALEYIGIGVAPNFTTRPEEMRRGIDTYRVTSLLKKISSSVRQFNSDIKKGIMPEDARALLVDDLNVYSRSKVRDNWIFFERTDANNDFPELMPKKKKVPTTRVLKSDVTDNMPHRKVAHIETATTEEEFLAMIGGDNMEGKEEV